MNRAIAIGIALGVVYTLSPLTVLCLTMLTALTWRIARDLTPRERAWFISVIAIATIVRLSAIAGLFLLADPSQPYANFFGDEELFKSRTLWLRNVSLGVPISPADMIYVFDDVGRSSYLYVLAYIQALVGDAPYGNNVMNATVYVSAIAILFAFMRRCYGQFVALSGAIFLLFVPSLFSWSISVLKEPFYIVVASIELIVAVYIVRAPKVWQRVAAAIGVMICALVLNSLRVGGMQLVIGGVLVGVPAGLLATRPRAALAAAVAVPVIVVLALTQPRVQERVMATLQDAAFQHWGHVATPGYSYKLLDPRFYADGQRRSVYTMEWPEAGRYAVRAVWSFITVPRSSQIESRSALAYLPEQALWYSIWILAPIGFVAGMRRDAVVTCMLASHGLVAAAMVALTSGNIGTLIRHRGLTLPYFTWLAALGACTVVYWLATRDPRARLSVAQSGEPA